MCPQAPPRNSTSSIARYCRGGGAASLPHALANRGPAHRQIPRTSRRSGSCQQNRQQTARHNKPWQNILPILPGVRSGALSSLLRSYEVSDPDEEHDGNDAEADKGNSLLRACIGKREDPIRQHAALPLAEVDLNDVQSELGEQENQV